MSGLRWYPLSVGAVSVIEHCLYGVKVFCDFALFDRSVPVSAVAPGEHSALQLRQAVTGAAADQDPQDISESFPLYSTHGRELLLRTDRELARSAAGQSWCLEVENVVSFTWIGSETTIDYQLHGEGTQALLVFWFVHIFLPLHLTLERGYDFIHGAAVEVDEQPIVFIAPSTGGKSTLGDYFLKQGHPMLSDDKIATFLQDGHYYAVPSHPHHRPFRQFEVLGNPVEYFADRARPIHAFYVLQQAEPNAPTEITEITGFRKFEELLPNYLYSFSFLQEQRLRWLAQLADQSLVYRVSRPWNLQRMHETYEAICTHARSLPTDICLQ
jgi:hypothetical protein